MVDRSTSLGRRAISAAGGSRSRMASAAMIGSDEFIRVPPVRLRVRRGGDGPPLLLINGIGAPLEMWEPLVRRLHGLELITFDLPGSGRSSLAPYPLRMRHFAQIVAELMARLGHDAAHVLGYSFGGAVAQELAHRSPARVDRLILCATTPGIPGRLPDPLVIALMLTPARYYSRGLGALIVPRIAGGRTARDEHALRAGLVSRQIHPPSLIGYMQQLSATICWSSRPWLGRIPHDTLVLHGDQDPVAPLQNAQQMAQRLRSARLSVIKGGGHLFLLDEAQTVAPVIEAFLATA
jgi:pimeloyl-ACP methyl ester carboxylesterase